MLKTVLTQTRTIHLRDSLLSMGFYVIGSLMPVWLSLPLLVLISQPIGFDAFLDNGQFAIYGAAAAAPILYSLFRQSPGAERALYFLLMLVCLLLTVAIFSGLIVVDSLSIGQLQINVSFLRILSITIYIAALLAMFFVDLHENVYQMVDVSGDRLQRQDKMDEQFDREQQSPTD